ncbi:carbonic anhydrase family protein [Liquorilactobacillus sicerae]|uniref:carbonic anhydrase family protein n=1 Tax=Liquorilactobacillus sicerae TaxID=1416943 RepID=UPI00247FC7AC|nr:carbonic anhydrase family protein [Liquorilactobacillus sicerae]
MLDYLHQSAWQSQLQPWQSPIDIEQAVSKKETPKHSAVSFLTSYQFTTVEHHGNNLQFNGQGQAQLNDRVFDFQQLHFHFPAEHLLNGKRYPLEWHFVHQNELGQQAVVAFWVKEGPIDQAMAPFYQQFSFSEGQKRLLPAKLMLPEIQKQHSAAVFNYLGSLTTPPLTRGVEWWVFQQPLSAAKFQLQQLRQQFLQDNARQVQSLSSRPIILYTEPNLR